MGIIITPWCRSVAQNHLSGKGMLKRTVLIFSLIWSLTIELQCSNLYCNYVLQGYHMNIVNSCSPRKKSVKCCGSCSTIFRQITRYHEVSFREFMTLPLSLTVETFLCDLLSKGKRHFLWVGNINVQQRKNLVKFIIFISLDFALDYLVKHVKHKTTSRNIFPFNYVLWMVLLLRKEPNKFFQKLITFSPKFCLKLKIFFSKIQELKNFWKYTNATFPWG